MVQRPEARALTAKVRRYRVDDEKLYSSKFGYTDVAIDTKRGRFSMRAERVSGSPEWPMTAAERQEKFIDCTEADAMLTREYRKPFVVPAQV